MNAKVLEFYGTFIGQKSALLMVFGATTIFSNHHFPVILSMMIMTLVVNIMKQQTNNDTMNYNLLLVFQKVPFFQTNTLVLCNSIVSYHSMIVEAFFL